MNMEGLELRKAAKLYDIDKMTLHRYKRDGKNNGSGVSDVKMELMSSEELKLQLKDYTLHSSYFTTVLPQKISFIHEKTP